jgi:hypothetical protein
MKSPHNALDGAAAIQFELEASAQENSRVITLGYQCAGWNFLVRNGDGRGFTAA